MATTGKTRDGGRPSASRRSVRSRKPVLPLRRRALLALVALRESVLPDVDARGPQWAPPSRPAATEEVPAPVRIFRTALLLLLFAPLWQAVAALILIACGITPAMSPADLPGFLPAVLHGLPPADSLPGRPALLFLQGLASLWFGVWVALLALAILQVALLRDWI